MKARKQSRKKHKHKKLSRISDGTAAISNGLRTARLAQSLSQVQLAAKLGLRQRQISDLERGAVDARLSTLQNVARALDLELMLVPRPLISAVEALQRASSEDAGRPLYTLDADDAAPEESHVEVGATIARGVGAEPTRTGKRPRS